jgi:hypothetical protein
VAHRELKIGGSAEQGPPHMAHPMGNTPKTAKTHTFKLLINQQQIEVKTTN